MLVWEWIAHVSAEVFGCFEHHFHHDLYHFFAVGKRQVLKRAYSMYACNCDFNDASCSRKWILWSGEFVCSSFQEKLIKKFQGNGVGWAFLTTVLNRTLGVVDEQKKKILSNIRNVVVPTDRCKVASEYRAW